MSCSTPTLAQKDSPKSKLSAIFMTNLLLHSLNKYYKEMMSLEGKIFVLNNIVKNFRDNLQKRETLDRELMGAISTFRDLSKITEGNNLYETGYSYSLSTSVLENEIEIILSKEYCLILSQAYEIFETYLADIFTDLFFLMPEKLVELKLLQTNLHLPKISLKEFVKEKLGRQKNNRKYINSLRKLSPHFVEFETKNIYKLNISVWFDLVSELRHNIIHNRQVISDKLLVFLHDNEREKLFKEFFERKSTSDGVVIFLTCEKFNIILDRLNEFAYFIFKSLAIDNNLDPTYKLIR
jgi:hypothetical protein